MEKYTRVSRGPGKTDSNKGLCDDKQNATYLVGLVQLRKPKPSSRITSVGKVPETLWDPTKHMFIIREPRGLICASCTKSLGTYIGCPKDFIGEIGFRVYSFKIGLSPLGIYVFSDLPFPLLDSQVFSLLSNQIVSESHWFYFSL